MSGVTFGNDFALYRPSALVELATERIVDGLRIGGGVAGQDVPDSELFLRERQQACERRGRDIKVFAHEVANQRAAVGFVKDDEIREKVGDGKVLLALSGGVDSSVAAGLLSRAIGKQLTCVFVDHGLLRKNEGDEVEQVFGEGGQFDLIFVRVNAQERYYAKLAGVEEPEKKRKIIGEEFIRVFEEEAKKIGAVDFLAQGTIYPDVVESGLGGESAVIKSHHNVGGLPDYVDFKEIIEPLRLLFKDEVRKAGLELFRAGGPASARGRGRGAAGSAAGVSVRISVPFCPGFVLPRICGEEDPGQRDHSHGDRGGV